MCFYLYRVPGWSVPSAPNGQLNGANPSYWVCAYCNNQHDLSVVEMSGIDYGQGNGHSARQHPPLTGRQVHRGLLVAVGRLCLEERRHLLLLLAGLELADLEGDASSIRPGQPRRDMGDSAGKGPQSEASAAAPAVRICFSNRFRS